MPSSHANVPPASRPPPGVGGHAISPPCHQPAPGGGLPCQASAVKSTGPQAARSSRSGTSGLTYFSCVPGCGTRCAGLEDENPAGHRGAGLLLGSGCQWWWRGCGLPGPQGRHWLHAGHCSGHWGKSRGQTKWSLVLEWVEETRRGKQVTSDINHKDGDKLR